MDARKRDKLIFAFVAIGCLSVVGICAVWVVFLVTNPELVMECTGY